MEGPLSATPKTAGVTSNCSFAIASREWALQKLGSIGADGVMPFAGREKRSKPDQLAVNQKQINLTHLAHWTKLMCLSNSDPMTYGEGIGTSECNSCGMGGHLPEQVFLLELSDTCERPRSSVIPQQGGLHECWARCSHVRRSWGTHDC